MAMYNRLCRLVSEYMRLAPSDMLQDNVDSLIGEATLRMVHTHEGCRVGCMVAAYSTPKQRKKLVKSMKGLVLKMCLDEFAYIALIKILQVVDDTELVRKSIVAEIQVSIRTLHQICCDFSLLVCVACIGRVALVVFKPLNTVSWLYNSGAFSFKRKPTFTSTLLCPPHLYPLLMSTCFGKRRTTCLQAG
jgi:hypothetical protein